MSISKSKNALFLVIMFSFLFQSPAFACSLCGSTEAKAEAIGLKMINEAVKSNPNTVIAFHSNSCGTCKVQKPKLQALLLKEKYSPKKDIFLDFDSEEEVRKNASTSPCIFMIGVASLALIANVSCLFILYKHKGGQVHMKASWIFSTNDVIANIGVILAGVAVLLTNSPYPDLVIGTIVGIIVLRGAF